MKLQVKHLYISSVMTFSLKLHKNRPLTCSPETSLPMTNIFFSFELVSVLSFLKSNFNLIL